MARYYKYRCLGDPDGGTFLGCYFYKNHFEDMLEMGHIPPGSIWKRDGKYFICEGAYFRDQRIVPLNGRRLKALSKRFKMLEFSLKGK